MTKDEKILLYWLFQLYAANKKKAWEAGPTVDEVTERVHHILHNFGVGPYTAEHQRAIDKLLATVGPKDWRTIYKYSVKDAQDVAE